MIVTTYRALFHFIWDCPWVRAPLRYRISKGPEEKRSRMVVFVKHSGDSRCTCLRTHRRRECGRMRRKSRERFSRMPRVHLVLVCDGYEGIIIIGRWATWWRRRARQANCGCVRGPGHLWLMWVALAGRLVMKLEWGPAWDRAEKGATSLYNR